MASLGVGGGQRADAIIELLHHRGCVTECGWRKGRKEADAIIESLHQHHRNCAQKVPLMR